jgi:hypothetical protein
MESTMIDFRRAYGIHTSAKQRQMVTVIEGPPGRIEPTQAKYWTAMVLSLVTV